MRVKKKESDVITTFDKLSLHTVFIYEQHTYMKIQIPMQLNFNAVDLKNGLFTYFGGAQDVMPYPDAAIILGENKRHK